MLLFQNALMIALYSPSHCLQLDSKTHGHISPIPASSHRLPRGFRIDFKILLPTFKARQGLRSTMLQTYLPLRVLQIFSWDLSVPACHRRWPGFCNMATSLNRTGKDHQCAPEHLFIHKSLLTVPFILVSIPIYRTISLSLVASPSCYEAI